MSGIIPPSDLSGEMTMLKLLQKFHFCASPHAVSVVKEIKRLKQPTAFQRFCNSILKLGFRLVSAVATS